MTRSRVAALGLAAVLLTAPACGPDPAEPPRLTVLAAASLTEAFPRIAQDYQASTGTAVAFSFGSSATLAGQVVAGAPADVFAAASPATMQTVVAAGRVAGTPQPFAANTLQIAVPPGNPGRVHTLADFARADLRIAVCAPQAPCGAAAGRAFAAAGVTPRPDTEEADVKATLAKVAATEVDAALVYRTDVAAASDTVTGIEFPEADATRTTYSIAALREARHPAAAQDFVDHVRSRAGATVLTEAGFARP